MALGGVEAPPESPILLAPFNISGVIWSAFSMKYVLGNTFLDIL